MAKYFVGGSVERGGGGESFSAGLVEGEVVVILCGEIQERFTLFPRRDEFIPADLSAAESYEDVAAMDHGPRHRRVERKRGTASIPSLALRASDGNGKLCDFSWPKMHSVTPQGRDEGGAQSGSNSHQAGDQAHGEHQGQHHCQRAVRYRSGAQQHVR